MELKEAEALCGKLTKTSKMPGYSFGLPAQHCKTGSKLREIEDSPCHGCYAFKGNYRFKGVKSSQQYRFDALNEERWVEGMVTLIKANVSVGVPYFRWHDSGDIQNMRHLQNIVKIADKLPMVNFWMPTQEHELVKQLDRIPPNLVIRLSNRRNGEHLENRGYHSSGTVRANGQWPEIVANNTKTLYACPSSMQDNQCKDCRACWNPKVEHVIYKIH